MRFFALLLTLFVLNQSTGIHFAHAKKKKNSKTHKSKYPRVVDHYRVEPDDTLNTISIRLYGTTRYGPLMYLWNKNKIRNINQIEVGMVLNLKKKKTFSKEAGDNQLYYHYRHMFGLTGPPQAAGSLARASVGTIQELPPTTTIGPAAATPETAAAIDEEKQRVLNVDPTAESVLKGEQLLKQNNLPAAKAEFVEARNDDPSNPAPRILEIATLIQMGNEPEAKERAHDLVVLDKEYCDLPMIKKLAESGDCP